MAMAGLVRVGDQLAEPDDARSGVDWTIMRPPWLSDGPRTGTYRQAKDSNLRGGSRISRADLADAILASLDDPDTVKATIAIGY
jgi:putative NADH-flavin reductase